MYYGNIMISCYEEDVVYWWDGDEMEENCRRYVDIEDFVF